ncbi:MAG: cytidylate kinase-like family protein [Coriobacteriales bacterium]|nr:cytidylate kinase-like family protein [Coriobacteriales bacterium]
MAGKIITISRQYGSGGREIGEKVAAALGYAYYDKELIRRVAQLGDIDVDFVTTSGEGVMGKLASLLARTGAGASRDEDSLPLSDRLFLVQSRIIKEIAAEGPCVIVGHSADYFLAECPDVLNVFIHANWECRVARVMQRNDLDEATAIARIKRIDRNRSSFYEQYTDRRWGQVENYHLTLSSSYFGTERAVAAITAVV